MNIGKFNSNVKKYQTEDVKVSTSCFLLSRLESCIEYAS